MQSAICRKKTLSKRRKANLMDNTAEIKAKWNAEHYDQMSVVVPKGSRDLIKQHANEQGMSISEYIRHLIAKDAPQCLTAGGGGIRP